MPAPDLVPAPGQRGGRDLHVVSDLRRVEAEDPGGPGVGELVAVLSGHGRDQDDLLGPGQAVEAAGGSHADPP
jgi:hypothetical protein